MRFYKECGGIINKQWELVADRCTNHCDNVWGQCRHSPCKCEIKKVLRAFVALNRQEESNGL